MTAIQVVDLAAPATHDLRRRVLRGGDPAADVHFAGDDHPGAVHLGATDTAGRLLGVATLSPQPCPHRPGRPALRLRGMAVEPGWQRRGGVGSRLLAAAVDRAGAGGYEVLWAEARDTALGFYTGAGMQVVGDGFPAAMGLPHHVVVLDL